MDKVILQVNDTQAWKPMWFKILNIDRTTNSIEVSFDGLTVFPEVWSLDLQKQDLKLVL